MSLLGVLLLAVNTALGFYGSWWMLIIPAFFAGWFVKTCVMRVVCIAAVLSWVAAALLHDIPTGFRLSMRIAGTMGLPGFIFAYLVMSVLVLILVALGTQSGKALRAGILARAL